MAYWAVDLLIARHKRSAISVALLGHSRSTAKFWLSHSARAACHGCFRSVPALLSARGNAAEMMKEGGRGNSSRLVNVITRVLVVGQIAMTAAFLIAAALQVRSIRNQTTARLWLRRKRRLQRAHGLFGGRLSDRRFAPRIFRPRRSRAARQSGLRTRL